ncbi:hypothetical protein Tco_1314254 [Tanacetum coccineum]
MPSPSQTFSFPSTSEPVFSVSTSEPVFESPNSQTSQNTQSQQQFQQYHTTTVSNNNAKFPYLKKDEYETWAMKMEYWIMNSDHNLWNIVLNGKQETKARTILLQSSLEDHMADFHHLDDARDIWLAVKARFGGNDESKKMRKSMLKQEFLEFRVSESEGLHKGYDRFEKKAGRKMKFNNRDAARFDKSKELDKSEEPKALLSVDSMLNWSDHEGEDEEKGVAQIYWMIAGDDDDAAGDVFDAAVEFDFMGLSSQVKLEKMNDQVKLEESKANIFDTTPEDVEGKPLYDRFVKAVGMHAVPSPITGTFMPPSNKPDLDDTQVTYGSNDKSSDSETIGFASCVSSVKSSSSKTNEHLASASSSVDFKTVSKTADQKPSSTIDNPSFSFKENVKTPRKICNKSGINNRSHCKNNSFGPKTCFVCGSKFHLIKDCDFYKQQLELYNKPKWHNVAKIPSFVPRAAYVPAGSRNPQASVSAGSAFPAGIRNPPASVSAGKQHKASYKAITAVSTRSGCSPVTPTMDLFGPTSIRSIDHKYCTPVAWVKSGTQDPHIHAGTQDDLDLECDKHLIVVPSFPSNCFLGPKVHEASQMMESNSDYAEELARLQRQEHEAKDTAEKYGFSKDT